MGTAAGTVCENHGGRAEDWCGYDRLVSKKATGVLLGMDHGVEFLAVETLLDSSVRLFEGVDATGVLGGVDKLPIFALGDETLGLLAETLLLHLQGQGLDVDPAGPRGRVKDASVSRLLDLLETRNAPQLPLLY